MINEEPRSGKKKTIPIMTKTSDIDMETKNEVEVVSDHSTKDIDIKADASDSFSRIDNTGE